MDPIFSELLTTFLEWLYLPKNGRTGPYKVPIEPYRSHEDLNIFKVWIRHSELLLEQFDRQQAIFYALLTPPVLRH